MVAYLSCEKITYCLAQDIPAFDRYTEILVLTMLQLKVPVGAEQHAQLLPVVKLAAQG